MERIFECYTDIICKAAEAGILTEEMKSFYLSEIENHSDSDQYPESEILDDEVGSSAIEHDDLNPLSLSQENNVEHGNEFEAKHREAHEPILVNSNLSEILSESMENCNISNVLQWQGQTNSFSSSDTESDIMSLLRNDSDILYDTHSNSHLLFKNKPRLMKNKCFDYSIPIYVDIPKKKAIIKPKTCLHQFYDEVRSNRNKSRSRADKHIDNEAEHHLSQASGKVRHHKFGANPSNLNGWIPNTNEQNISESNKMEYNVKIKKSSKNKKCEHDIGNETEKIQNIPQKDVSKAPCENLHEIKAAKLQQCKIFERKQKNKFQKTECVHPTSNQILPNSTEVNIDDFSDACKNKPKLRFCSFCGTKQKGNNEPSRENETNTDSSDANRISDERYEQCLNVNIICKFYSKADSAEGGNESTILETSSDNCSKKEKGRKNDQSRETSERKILKRKPMCRISKIFSGIRQPNR